MKGDIGDLDDVIDNNEKNYKTTYQDVERPIKKLRLSNEVKDLLTRLLDKDPSTRLSAEECLQHPWLQKNTKALQIFTDKE
jgi:serine/threonine protein kinase